jgi:hypothetical protein
MTQTLAEAHDVLRRIREYNDSRSNPRASRLPDPGLVPVPAPDFTIQTAVSIILALTKELKPDAANDFLIDLLLAAGSAPCMIYERSRARAKGGTGISIAGFGVRPSTAGR